MSIFINRKPNRFLPDTKRVIARYFFPGSPDRAKKVIMRIMSLKDEDATRTLNQTLRDFSDRHRNITRIFQKHFNNIEQVVNECGYQTSTLSLERKLLIGSYFTSEYSIESAAFFNPSMVEDPDQANLSEGQKRIIVSFRATGEGHISSLVFRGGIIDKNGHLEFKPAGKLVDEAETIQRHQYSKESFLNKLREMDVLDNEIISKIMSRLNDSFDYGELHNAINSCMDNIELNSYSERVLEAIRWLAQSHYEICFSFDTSISERVIFPIASTESNGIEDARFVKFTDNDEVTYYATYTAYNGFGILPKLIVTKDFYNFKVMPLYGPNARSKGMALFPRKINGKYAMLSRYEGENNFIMFSDNIHFWNEEAKLIQEPEFPWEFIQLGNSGAPLETDQGWLVLTHGVGPMRRYCIGAILLDIDNPQKVIGKLSEPLIVPTENEREGYVPNVVYSCGSMIHNNELIIPYAMSDYCSGIASVSLDALFERMRPTEHGIKERNGRHKSRKILVVDDDLIFRKLIEDVLIKEGYHVHLASDGLDALMIIGKENFDLILSDVNMPNLGGFDLLRYLTEKKIKTPVALMTSNDTPEFEIEGFDLGAMEFISKPINPRILVMRLDNLLIHI
jgi:predicted GH43/DUF377 family glycosyl hydrolase